MVVLCKSHPQVRANKQVLKDVELQMPFAGVQKPAINLMEKHARALGTIRRFQKQIRVVKVNNFFGNVASFSSVS